MFLPLGLVNSCETEPCYSSLLFSKAARVVVRQQLFMNLFPSQQLMLMAVLNCLFDSLSQMLRYVCARAALKKKNIIWNKYLWKNKTAFVTLQKKRGEEGFIGEHGGSFSRSGRNCWRRVSKNKTLVMSMFTILEHDRQQYIFLKRGGGEKDVVWKGWVTLYCLLQGDSGERPSASGAPCGPQSMSLSPLTNIQHWVGSLANKPTHPLLFF